MAVVYEEFIRCSVCGCAEFKKEELLTFHKKILPRQSATMELSPLETRIVYVCVDHGHVLDK
jgi:uncharacterized protein (DUF2225 family)